MSDSRALAAVLVIAAATGLAFQGSRGLYETTEGRYAEAAREMLVSGTWAEPLLAGRPHLTKPPLAYWAIAAGMAVLGVNEWGARAVQALAFVVSALLVVAIGTRLWDRRTGLIAGLVHATSAFAVGGAAALSTDAILVVFELAAVLAWLEARRSQGIRARVLVAACWLALGFGFLTKGPAALLPLAPMLGHDLLDKRPFRLLSIPGLALFAVVGLGWYWVIARRHAGSLDFMIDQQLTGRLFVNQYHRNARWWGPLKVYLLPLSLGLLPWTAWAGWLAIRRRLPLRPLLAPGPRALLFLWVVPPLVVLSLARSRLPLYALPLCAPLALGAARVFTLYLADPLRGALRVAVALAVLLVIGKGIAARVEAPEDMRLLHGEILERAGPNARVVAWREESMHGLRFYRSGELTRATPTGEERWADATLDQVVAAGGAPLVFVTRGPATKKLTRVLQGKGVAVRRDRVPGWDLLIAE